MNPTIKKWLLNLLAFGFGIVLLFTPWYIITFFISAAIFDFAKKRIKRAS
jgi:hypothetical protein